MGSSEIPNQYAKPHIELKADTAYDGTHFLSDTVTFKTKGFSEAPSLFWRRVGFGTDEMAMVPWTEITAGTTWTALTDGLGELEVSLSGTDRFAYKPGTDGHKALRNQIVQVMALRSGDDAAAACSFYATNIDLVEPPPEPGG